MIRPDIDVTVTVQDVRASCGLGVTTAVQQALMRLGHDVDVESFPDTPPSRQPRWDLYRGVPVLVVHASGRLVYARFGRETAKAARLEGYPVMS